jgi:LPS sulfotransferase NodH
MENHFKKAFSISTIDRLIDDLSDTSAHFKKVDKHFNGKLLSEKEYSKENDPVETLFVGFTNRCGSNFLCAILASTGKFNSFSEPLNFNEVIDRSKKNNIKNYEDYLREIKATRAVGNRFSIKASVDQLAFLKKTGLLDKVFPHRKFLLVERCDKLSQAISYMIAIQTKKWSSTQIVKMDNSKINYNDSLVVDFLNGVTKNYREFDLLFSLLGETYHKVVYEQLCQRPQFEANKIFDFLNIKQNIPLKKEDISLRIQRNSLNEKFTKMFHELHKL